MTILEEYIVALTNLYGCVSKEKVMEIFNEQTELDVENLDTVDIFVLEEYYVIDYDEYFVLDDIYRTDYVDELIEIQANQPFYVPNQEELLNYVDGYYFEITKEYEDLAYYIKEQFHYDEDDLSEIMDDLHFFILEISDPSELTEFFDEAGLEYDNHLVQDELIHLAYKMYDSTRRYELNGHTINEMKVNNK